MRRMSSKEARRTLFDIGFSGIITATTWQVLEVASHYLNGDPFNEVLLKVSTAGLVIGVALLALAKRLDKD